MDMNDGWILTASGQRFELFAPEPQTIFIGDIAHALANCCRFAGHVRDYYSVAQHSVLVSHHVPPDEALTALMHDATEAYVGDMVRPLKRRMSDYVAVEGRIWEAIRARFGLGALTPAIKVADERALQTERRDLFAPSAHVWHRDEQLEAQAEDEPGWIAAFIQHQDLYGRCFRLLAALYGAGSGAVLDLNAAWLQPGPMPTFAGTVTQPPLALRMEHLRGRSAAMAEVVKAWRAEAARRTA